MVDHSPTSTLATREELGPLGSFLKDYGVDLPMGRFRDEDADPMDKLRSYLARTDRTGPSRFSDGSFPASEGRSGITYRSVRRKGAENLGVLRSRFARAGNAVKVIAMRWDGAKVVPLQGL